MLLLFAALSLSAVAARAPVNDWSPKCLTCKSAVKIVEKYLKSGAGIKEIISKVDAFCDYVTEDVRPICDQLVSEKVPQIVEWIEKQIETHDICKMLDFCK